MRDDADWRRLASVVGELDATLSLEQRRARAETIATRVEAWTSQRSAREVEQALQAVGVPAHELLNSAGAAADAQLAHREHFLRLPHQLHGETVVEGPRYRLSDTPGAPTAPAPMVGQHTAQVLREILDYGEARITALAAAGALS